MSKHRFLVAYLLLLTVFTAYVVMDTFVITRVYGNASDNSSAAESTTDGAADITTDGAADSTPDDAANETDSSAAASESSHSHGPGGSHVNGGPPSGGPGHGGQHSRPDSNSSGDSQSNSSDNTSSGSSSGSSSDSTAGSSSGSSDLAITGVSAQDSYTDENISVELSEYTVSGTVIHVAEVKTSAQYLKTAFAQGAYGKNVTATTSDIADSVSAILAINGDYYGSQEKGYVIRNGKLYRSAAVSGREDLVVYQDGSFEIINESEVTAEELIAMGAVQTLSFGPALIENGQVSVDSDDEVGRAMASNPRTAIGIKPDGTYIFVVSDGRTEESEGFSLLQLAEFMKYLGAETAYNLDGGGSSAMVFKGSVVNTPTGGGIGNGSGSERKVSDIVYIGY